MQFYSDEIIKKRFKSKRQDCNKRNLEFEFTYEDFYKFCRYLDEHPICAYTGEKLTSISDRKNSASIERVDGSKGYSIENCVWTTTRANRLKGVWDARSKMVSVSFTKPQLVLMDKIFKADIKSELHNIYKFVKEVEYNMTVNAINNVETKEQNQISDAKDTNENSNCINIYATNTENSSVYSVNDDVSLAVSYSKFAEHCQQHVDFLLSFNEYKKLMSRKKCQLTMQNFDEEHKRSLFVIDKTQPIVVSNLLTVDLKLRHNLDSFIGKTKLTNKQLKNIFKNLGEVMKD